VLKRLFALGIVVLVLPQLPLRGQMRDDFETAVMQAVIGSASSATN
jgi:hypothetical protein